MHMYNIQMHTVQPSASNAKMLIMMELFHCWFIWCCCFCGSGRCFRKNNHSLDYLNLPFMFSWNDSPAIPSFCFSLLLSFAERCCYNLSAVRCLIRSFYWFPTISVIVYFFTRAHINSLSYTHTHTCSYKHEQHQRTYQTRRTNAVSICMLEFIYNNFTCMKCVCVCVCVKCVLAFSYFMVISSVIGVLLGQQNANPLSTPTTKSAWSTNERNKFYATEMYRDVSLWTSETRTYI